MKFLSSPLFLRLVRLFSCLSAFIAGILFLILLKGDDKYLKILYNISATVKGIRVGGFSLILQLNKKDSMIGIDEEGAKLLGYLSTVLSTFSPFPWLTGFLLSFLEFGGLHEFDLVVWKEKFCSASDYMCDLFSHLTIFGDNWEKILIIGIAASFVAFVIRLGQSFIPRSGRKILLALNVLISLIASASAVIGIVMTFKGKQLFKMFLNFDIATVFGELNGYGKESSITATHSKYCAGYLDITMFTLFGFLVFVILEDILIFFKVDRQLVVQNDNVTPLLSFDAEKEKRSFFGRKNKTNVKSQPKTTFFRKQSS
eukprot:GDKJ01041491.1.p1 GENE.GDKJ01041491.1~~GDKJ01041491.1.p1  ORF type:complete len:324 (-),score=50.95 GDKJ01041491.1:658-1599(-)